MKIALVVHSKTGNTLSVAERLKASLAGHEAQIIRVRAVDEDAAAKGKPVLAPPPDISGYDAYVFAAPVWGFSLSPIMSLFVGGTSDLCGKKTACFVTQQFSHAWLGGNRAVRQLESALSKKGACVSAKGVIGWSSKKRENEISELVSRLSGNF